MALVLLALVAVGTIIPRLKERSAAFVPGHVLLGRNAPLGGIPLLPDDSPWNTPVDDRPVDRKSGAYLARIGLVTALHPDFGTNRLGTSLYGIPYVVVDGSQVQPVEPEFTFRSQSDPGPYPIPDDPPIEKGGDRHLLMLDRETWTLHELYLVTGSEGHWQAGSGAVFPLGSNQSRPRGWTSGDAAGLPILPGLARTDEVYGIGEIRHALRFTLPHTRQAFVYPARHHAGRDDNEHSPPMGLRLRLRADVAIDHFPPGARVIATALKRYGMILADNGGAMYLTGTADRRWRRADIVALKGLTVGDFEVIVPPPPPVSDVVAQREVKEGLAGFTAQ